MRLLGAGIAVVAGAGVADGLVSKPAVTPAPKPSAGRAIGALVSAPDAESSAWFCVGASGSGGSAVGALMLVNPTGRALGGTVTVAPSVGGAKSIEVSVPPESQIGVLPADVASGPWVAATVLFDGGGAGVTQVVSGPLGWSTAPCASTTSSNWYFAHGSTASGASLTLALYNPSTTDAVANVTLDSSSQGVLQPPAYQGVPVPAGSLVVENVSDHLLNDPSVATVVSTSSGTVVAAELQSTPLSGGGGGSSLLLGVPEPATKWDFPQNSDPPNGGLVFHVFNPSARQVSVSVRVGIGPGASEPLSVEVPPESVFDLVAERQTRIPASSPYSIELTTHHGVGIVVDREVASGGGTAAPRVGQVHGVPGGTTAALLPADVYPGSPASGASSLTVANLSAHRVTITVESIVKRQPLAGLDSRPVPPGGSLTAGEAPGSPIGLEPLLVLASGPVAVELDATPSGTPGAVVLPALVLG